MKLPASAGIFVYISEIYMSIFRYISEIYIKLPAAAGNFKYISVPSGGFEPSRAKFYIDQINHIYHQTITTAGYWLLVYKPQDKFLIKLVHSSEKKLFDIKFLT